MAPPSSPHAVVFKEVTFEAAHRLPNLPEDHKCFRLHGHSFAARISVRGPIDPALGWVVDFADIKAAFQPLHDQLDHSYLNEIEGLEVPTSEHIAVWIWDRLIEALPGLDEVEVRETCNAGCRYRGGA